MKTIVHYLFLVGIPVLGVLGLLQVGKGITPPISVGGRWHVEPATKDNNQGCLVAVGNGLETLDISQSGRTLRIAINGDAVVFDGIINDATISAEARDLALHAVVEQQKNSRQLAGTITGKNCPSLSWQGSRAVQEKETR